MSSVQIQIDNLSYEWPKGAETIAGWEVLELVGKDSREWRVNAKMRNQDGRRVRIDEYDSIAYAEVERFETVRAHALQG